MTQVSPTRGAARSGKHRRPASEMMARARRENGIGMTIPAENVPPEVLAAARGPVRERLMLVPAELFEDQSVKRSRKRSADVIVVRWITWLVVVSVAFVGMWLNAGSTFAIHWFVGFALLPLIGHLAASIVERLVDRVRNGPRPRPPNAFNDYREIMTRVQLRKGHVCVWCGVDLSEFLSHGRCERCDHAFSARSTRQYWGFGDEGVWIGPLRVGLLTDAPIAGGSPSPVDPAASSDDDSELPDGSLDPIAPESTPRTR